MRCARCGYCIETTTPAPTPVNTIWVLEKAAPLHNVMSARISGVWRFPYAIPRTTAQLLESGWTILSLFAKVDEEPEFKVG